MKTCWRDTAVTTDSQGTPGTLDYYLVRLREVLRCRGLLGKNSDSLLRVPEHSGAVAIGKVDRVANRETRDIRATRCKLGVSDYYQEKLLSEWLERLALISWHEERCMRQAELRLTIV